MTDIIEAFSPPEPLVETYPEFVARHWTGYEGRPIATSLYTYAAAVSNLVAALACGLAGHVGFNARMASCGLGLITNVGAVTGALLDDPENRERLLEALGATLFWFTALSAYVEGPSDLYEHARKALHALIGQCGFTLAQVERANVEKLERS